MSLGEDGWMLVNVGDIYVNPDHVVKVDGSGRDAKVTLSTGDVFTVRCVDNDAFFAVIETLSGRLT
jgi:hypothetical protein